MKSIVRSIFTGVALILSFNSNAQIPYVYTDSLINQATELAAEEKFEEGIAILDTVHPGDTLYYKALSAKMEYLRKIDKARESLELAQSALRTPTAYRQTFLNGLALAYDALDMYDSAMYFYDLAIQEFPYSFLGHFNKGITYSRMNKYGDAAKEFQRSIELQPYFSNAHLNLALTTARMGLKAKTQLAMSMYLALNTSNNSALVALNKMYEGTWEIFGTTEATINNEAFSEIDIVLDSKVAQDEKFETEISIKAPVAQQSELIMELLEYDSGSEDFWMSFYVPLYQKIHSEGLTPAFVHHILQSSNNENVTKWIDKNDKEMQAFFDLANNYIEEYRSHTESVVGGVKGYYYKWFYGNNLFNAIGNSNENEDNIGPFEFYHPNQELSAIGRYNDEGYKIGPWKYFYETGIISKEESYDESGNLQGKVIEYFPNGQPKMEMIYDDNTIQGIVKFFYPAGNIKEELPAKDGLRQGAGKVYYESGDVNYTYTYDNNLKNGKWTYYFPTGELSTEIQYDKDSIDGMYYDYFINGVKYQEGKYEQNKLVGHWIIRYRNGNINSEGDYKDGERVGIWKYYDKDGAISYELHYENGGIVKEVYYDTDGKLHYEMDVKDGKLVGYKFYDKSGNPIAENRSATGDFPEYKAYYADGSLWIQGSYKNGMSDGKFTYHGKHGGKDSEITFRNGLKEGEAVYYYENGQISSSTNYVEDMEDGYRVDYFDNGVKSLEGWYKSDVQQQLWKSYQANGIIETETYLLNGKVNGPKKYYDIEGRLNLVEWYNEGLITKLQQYDTTGNLYHTQKFDLGTGEYIMKYPAGQIFRKVLYKSGSIASDIEIYAPTGKRTFLYPIKSGVYHGDFTDFYDDGTMKTQGSYVNNNLHGMIKHYDLDGNLEVEEEYFYGVNEGKYLSYYSNGKIKAKRNYSNGEPFGWHSFYAPDGSLRLEKYYNQYGIAAFRYLKADGTLSDEIPVDRRQAEIIAYFENGKVSSRQQYMNGSFDGEIIDYYPNGQIEKKYTYRNKQLDGVQYEYFENGTVKRTENYKNGLLDGYMKEYHETGQLKRSIRYKDGQWHGWFRKYDEGGKLIEERFYVNGLWNIE